MDIVESINRYLAGSTVNKGVRTRLTRARDEIMRLRTPPPASKPLTAPKFIRNVDGVPCITLVEHEYLMRDLLEALKNLVMVSQHLGACEATVEDARNVIAKATGEPK